MGIKGKAAKAMYYMLLEPKYTVKYFCQKKKVYVLFHTIILILLAKKGQPIFFKDVL